MNLLHFSYKSLPYADLCLVLNCRLRRTTDNLIKAIFVHTYIETAFSLQHILHVKITDNVFLYVFKVLFHDQGTGNVLSLVAHFRSLR